MILVTGATGFVGQHLMERLRGRGEALRPLVRDARDARDAERLRSLDVEPVVGDVVDPAALARAMAGVDTVVHLAAITVEKGAATFDRVNARGTYNVVDAARHAGVARFLYLSASGARDDPRYPYLRSKWRGEQAVAGSGIPYVVLRPSLIFGRSDHFCAALASLARRSPVVPIPGDGQSLFQPVWVEDVCTCVLKALDDDVYLGGVYEIGGPEQLSYDEIADIVMRVLGKRRRKVHVPLTLLTPAVAVMRALALEPPIAPGRPDLLEIDSGVAPNTLPALFGIERPAYLQAKLDDIRGW